MAHLVIEHLTVRLGDPARVVLDDVSVEFAPGTITLLLGANGSGKSVLIRSVLGLHPHAAGTITLNGTAVRDNRAAFHGQCGVTFQNSDVQIFGDSVLEDICIGSPAAMPVDMELCEAFGIAHLLSRSPAELSGGQRRRVAVVGALHRRPPFLLLDEPFLELDFPTIETLVRVLAARREAGATVILASHETQDILPICDHVVVMHAGRIAAAGAPSQVHSSISRRYGLRPLAPEDAHHPEDVHHRESK